MASDRVQSFIAAMKLRELKEGRDRLISAYDEIEEKAAAAPDRPATLRWLAERLAALRLADRPVHPEVANLEIAFAGENALVERWIERLRVEVRRGRARADVMPVLGGLFGEWIRPGRAHPTIDANDLEKQRARWFSTAPRLSFVEYLDKTVDPARVERARICVRALSVRAFGARDAPPVSFGREILAEGAWAEGADVVSELLPDGTMSSVALDFASAVRIAWESVGSWDWPDEGVELRPVWARSRFRLRPALDFLSAVTVEAVGEEMSTMTAAVSGRARLNRLLRLKRLEELDAPDIIQQNERQMLAQTFDVFGWLGSDELGADGTIRRRRLAAKMLSSDGGDYDYAQSEIGKGFAWLAAEIDLARAQERPVFVIKTDLADFYPSVSHELVRDLLVWMGCDARWVDLVSRVLSLRLPDGTRTTRGLPLGLSLSRCLGELLVGIFVGAARSAGEVQVVSMVDDVVIVAESADAITAAWAAFRASVEAAGLMIKEEKTGAIAIGAALPSGIPQGPIRWGLLKHEGVEFCIDDEAVAHFAEVTRAHVEAEEALLDRVAAWREQLRYATTWLAPHVDLAPNHLERVSAAIERIDPGLRESLPHEIEKRFLGGSGARLPDAWLHWPITAGGCGLPWPRAELVPLQLSRSARETLVTPGSPERALDDPAWGDWYQQRSEVLLPRAPVETAASSALVTKFLERGQRMGQSGKELSVYWRWVLHTLGPDVLDAYGTHDFVGTDLVPVALIRRVGA